MAKKEIEVIAGYFRPAFGSSTALVAEVRIRLSGINYDTMVGTGLSGALVVPILARALRKRFLIVRKEDGSHSSNKAEGRLGERWLFVDDLVSSGATRSRCFRVIKELEAFHCHSSKHVGTLEYAALSTLSGVRFTSSSLYD